LTEGLLMGDPVSRIRYSTICSKTYNFWARLLPEIDKNVKFSLHFTDKYVELSKKQEDGIWQLGRERG